MAPSASKLPNDVTPNQVARIPPGMISRETNGEYTLLTVSVSPGGQNAAHRHGSYSETFTAEKGQVGIYTKSTGNTMLSPAREGFEKGSYIPYGLARDGLSVNGGIPNKFLHSAIIFPMSDMWPSRLGGMLLAMAMKTFVAHWTDERYGGGTGGSIPGVKAGGRRMCPPDMLPRCCPSGLAIFWFLRALGVVG
ncbi:hypothetical protein FQN54_003287 [Arachnomyces sp. PD_36]|nr:hypothetical protein FQN54_003287 [Arachnomyces sp. PD_36]